MKLRKIFAAFLLCLSVGSAMAQMPAIPVDKNVKIGHLDNGLTYYIRHNSYPEHVASFYIAQKVGSINENDDQRGLAHLLEHLAFNGTDHFKGNSLQDYLQSIGVEYGRNLNAYTSVEKTVYYFTDVPTTRPTAVDSCMLILKDWSNGISLTEEAINDERDVVHNEYRMRIVGQQRMIERSLPKLYQNNKYGYRFPIGLMSVIDGCKPETLRAYYRKWYRPDNQAIIIVGDVDVNHIENKIKELFSGIKVPANAAKIEPVEVADNDTAIYVIDKDKEQQYDIFNIFMKHPAIPNAMKGNMSYLMKGYMDNVVTSMLGARYAEIAQEADCPFLQAGADDGDFLLSSTKGAFSLIGVAKPGKMKEAYAAVLREAKRMHDFGFTATEYQRAKEEFLSQVDKTLANKDKMKNVSMVLMREAEGAVYPTEKELADIVKQVRSEKLEAYVDNVKQEPLMAQLPKPGKIKKTVENKQLGYKQLTLSNGAKVVLKKTDFKDNEILFSANAKVGYSALEKSDYPSIMLMSEAWGASGLGDFSSTELEKALAGKQAGVGFSIKPYSHGLSGNSTPKDIETLMQLIYLKMTALSKDEKSFKNLQNTFATVLANQSNNPNMVYQDSLQSTLYLGSKIGRIPSSDEINAINYDRLMALAKEYYGNAKDFTFYFVGNYDEKTLFPLIEQYIASLPNNGFKLKNKEIPYAKGEVKNNFTKAMSNPQTQASEIWSTKLPFSMQNMVLADVTSRLLEMQYLRTIREQLSAAYHAGATFGMLRDFDDKAAISITANAGLNPEKADTAIIYFFKGVEEVEKQVDAADLQKVKEILLKQAGVDEKNNAYWLGVIANYTGIGFDNYTGYKEFVKNLRGEQISDFLKNVLLKSGNHVEVIMKAEKSQE